MELLILFSLLAICIYMRRKKPSVTTQTIFLIMHIDGSVYKKTNCVKIANDFKSKGFFIKSVISSQEGLFTTNL